jgi:formylglycine-generating enzyme required for sulfatase activity
MKMQKLLLFVLMLSLSSGIYAQFEIPTTKPKTNTPPTVTTGTLKVICGADGELLIDGETKGQVSENEIKKITLKPGKVIVQLKPADGRKMLTEIVTVTSGKEDALALIVEASVATKYNSTLLLESTLSANVKINGESRGLLNANSPTTFGVIAGTNIVLLESLDGKYRLTETLECKSSNQTYRKIDLLEQQRQAAEVARRAEPMLVYVEGGTFTMGCSSEQSDCETDEKPTHQVTLSSYYIGKYEVTQAQWEAVMGNNPSYFKCASCPVEVVSWDDVQVFISELNNKSGKRYRLPTEAEWEYAARGGAKSQGYKYSGSNELNSVGWNKDNSGDKTHPVGQKSPNELGIYDMTGNVWEWCSDWYGGYSSGSQTNPEGVSNGSYRVLRGGSWDDNARGCRVADRRSLSPDYRGVNYGFRLVLVP